MMDTLTIVNPLFRKLYDWEMKLAPLVPWVISPSFVARALLTYGLFRLREESDDHCDLRPGLEACVPKKSADPRNYFNVTIYLGEKMCLDVEAFYESGFHKRHPKGRFFSGLLYFSDQQLTLEPWEDALQFFQTFFAEAPHRGRPTKKDVFERSPEQQIKELEQRVALLESIVNVTARSL